MTPYMCKTSSSPRRFDDYKLFGLASLEELFKTEKYEEKNKINFSTS